MFQPPLNHMLLPLNLMLPLLNPTNPRLNLMPPHPNQLKYTVPPLLHTNHPPQLPIHPNHLHHLNPTPQLLNHTAQLPILTPQVTMLQHPNLTHLPQNLMSMRNQDIHPFQPHQNPTMVTLHPHLSHIMSLNQTMLNLLGHTNLLKLNIIPQLLMLTNQLHPNHHITYQTI